MQMNFRYADKLGLLLATLFVIGGAALIAFPQEMMLRNAANSASPRNGSAHVTHNTSRAFGEFSVLLGIGLLAVSVYLPKRSR
nr:putative integron gene cassette protein [uncultured bacterium]